MKFVTSCCNRPIEDCPGCPGGMFLMNVEESEDGKELEPSELGEKIGIDWDKAEFDKDQFKKGVDAELKEHSDDPETKVIDSQEAAAKVAWAHLKEDPKYYDKLDQLEESYNQVIRNIRNNQVTINDFCNLIDNSRLVHESIPSSIRDRIRRRVTPSNKANRKKHDSQGHKAGSFNVAGRVQPKRKPSGQAQMNGRGRAGHRHSTRKQRRNAALEDKRSEIAKQIGMDLSEQILDTLNREHHG